MLYIIVGLLALAMIGTGGGYYKGRTDGVDIYKAKVEAQQKEIEAAAAQLKQEAENHIQDMQTAYETGEAQAKTITRTIYAKGQSDVSKYPVFVNPVCVLPDDSLHVLNGARARQYVAADSTGIAPAVPVAPASGGRQDGNDVPANAGGRSAGVGVHQPTGATGSSAEIPRASGGKPPKPVPK